MCKQVSRSTSRRRLIRDSESDEDDPLSRQSSSSPSTSSTNSPRAVSSSTSSPSTPRSIAMGISRYVVKTTENQRKQLDEALARAVYMSGLSFSTLEDPFWKYAIGLLRDGYEPPSAFRLRTSLLMSEYTNVMNCTKTKIKSAECLALITDGWSNIRRECLMNFIVTTPEPVFLKAVAPGKNRETGDFISTEIFKVIES